MVVFISDVLIKAQPTPLPDLAKWERTAVRRGAHLLDEVLVKWWTYVDIDRLEFDSAVYDLLGQLYGSYYHAVEELGIDSERACEYGFDSSIKSYQNPELIISFQRLESYWREEINDRLEKCGR